MTGRFDRPGLLGAVTSAAVLDGTPQVIRNVVTHATARRPAPGAGGDSEALPGRPAGSAGAAGFAGSAGLAEPAASEPATVAEPEPAAASALVVPAQRGPRSRTARTGRRLVAARGGAD
ncbi:hypothetical protein SAMN04515669_2698 [Jiangella sp. DSM 45060]|nr:hypothetical protein SAMN04515669_2698 [Jiangella sp. DSM 45060]